MFALLTLALVLADAEPTEKPKIVAKNQNYALFAAGKANEKAASDVINDATELSVRMGKGASKEKECLEAAARAFKVKEIDLKKQTIVVLMAGQKPTGGYSVEITEVLSKDGKTIVKWKLNSPGADDIVTQAITYPGAVALITKTPGKIVFDPPVPPAK
jgi:hypothetical protein